MSPWKLTPRLRNSLTADSRLSLGYRVCNGSEFSSQVHPGGTARDGSPLSERPVDTTGRHPPCTTTLVQASGYTTLLRQASRTPALQQYPVCQVIPLPPALISLG